MSPVMSWADRRKIASEATSGFTLLEPNTYSFLIKEPAEVTEKDGWPRFKIKAFVEAGPRTNAMVFHSFYTTEKPNGMKMFYDQLGILGLSEDWLDQVTDDHQIGAAFQGKRFTAELFHEDYQGKTNQKLRKISAPVGSPMSGPGAGPAPAAAAGPNPYAAPAVQAGPPAAAYAAPVAQAAPPAAAYAAPVAQAAPPTAAYAAPVAQQDPAAQFSPPADSPWATGVQAPPAPPFG